MALIRAELQGDPKEVFRQREDGSLETESRGVYDGIIEAASDLTLSRLGDFDPGSMLYCLDDGSVYVKNSQGVWTEVSL